MDGRQPMQRTSSSSIAPGPYQPNMNSPYAMSYQGQPHQLPPIQHPQSYQQPNQNYLQYNNRPELPRYQSAPQPMHGTDRYSAPSHLGPQSSLGGPLPPSSNMLPQPNHQYPQQQNYPPTTSAPPGYPQRIAPAPPRNDLAPLSTSFGQPDNRPPTWTTGADMSNIAAESPRDQSRVHVVGSQGRRGILPSAPGRAAVTPNSANGSPKNAAIPAKDADGKFPCPNCNKTYLHAKHLKRHMLRHTGDRPYMCVLCRDTFSRSDILKRHFQKCSVRRGNPSGLSHLSSPAAHLKKSQAAAAKASENALSNSTTPTSNNIANGSYTNESAVSQGNTSATAANFSQSPSLNYPMAGSEPGNLQRPAYDQSFTPTHGNVGPNANGSWALHNQKPGPMLYQSNPASPANFGMPTSSADEKRGVIAGGHQQTGEGWMAYPESDDFHMNPMGFNNIGPGYEHQNNGAKKEEYPQDGSSEGHYLPSTSLGADGTLGPPFWNLDMSQHDPLQTKVDRLVDFCFPGGIQDSLDHQSNLQTRSCLTVENIRHYLDLFANFQGHFPYLHMATFNFTESYDGLILAIICIGAVYSTRIQKNEVRDLVQRTKNGIERTSSIVHKSESAARLSGISPSGIQLQELEALLMLNTIGTWHGGPVERALARVESQRLFNYVRQFGMLELAKPGSEAYSYTHNILDGESLDLNQWDWRSWIEQEKRSRIMYLVFLFDTALNIWFNCPPQFDPSEVRLPLPCNDAAWEASTSDDCARALGLHGVEAQLSINTSGSLQPKQLEIHNAISSLFNTACTITPRATNVYGKFILIHVLHIQIWQIQKQRSSTSGPHSPTDTTPPNGTASPGASFMSNRSLRAVTAALIRWKSTWDQDMQLQYPPSAIPQFAPRRIGFCRDGVHFYWLARAFLHPSRTNDWQLAPDTRLKQVISGLKQVRKWTKSEAAQRGEEPGSISDIDHKIAQDAEALQLDLTQLFRPLGEVYDSPTAQIHAQEGRTKMRHCSGRYMHDAIARTGCAQTQGPMQEAQ